MSSNWRWSHRAIVLLILVVGGVRMLAGPLPSDNEAIAHALSRLTFGARPGDLERVRGIGLSAWLDQQLSPNGIDDSALQARLDPFETLSLDSRDIARDFFVPARQARRARQRAAVNAGGATDPTPAGDQPMRDPPPAAPGGSPDTSTVMSTPRPPEVRRGRQPVRELSQAKMLRAVYSERQLEEVLVDFWFNHFNVFAGKGRTAVYVTEYEREAIRPHVLGRFRDLLQATAQSPAMLFYLDNWMSANPAATPGAGRPRQSRGLNENYGRELLELHTLGVDGGYTQADVIDVARAFTGWTIGPLGRDGFRFVPALHDRGVKHVLGHTLEAGRGLEDGEQVLDILAAHPSTARHIATELARRFVADAPPAALVDRAAKRFQETRGDLREVVRLIVTSPEFFAPAVQRAKMKTPLEFIASALRASGANVRNATAALRTLQQLGMAPFMCQPPTGYDDTADAWVSSGALVTRMNFATQLASGRIAGITLPPGAPSDLAVRLGSPEFQRR